MGRHFGFQATINCTPAVSYIKGGPTIVPAGPTARESNLCEWLARGFRVPAKPPPPPLPSPPRRRASARAEVRPAWRTFRALILDQLFIRLLFNFPFLTCPFPQRQRASTVVPRHLLPADTLDVRVAYRVSDRLKNKHARVSPRRKNPSRIMPSRGCPAVSLALSLSNSDGTQHFHDVFRETRERNSESVPTHAIPHKW